MSIAIDEGLVNGWRLEALLHLRHGQPEQPPRWYCSMMRVRDGTVVGYESPAGIKQAYEGCARLTRDMDQGDYQ